MSSSVRYLDSTKDNLLFFYLLMILLLKDTPYCAVNPTVFQLFFLNLVLLMELFL